MKTRSNVGVAVFMAVAWLVALWPAAATAESEMLPVPAVTIYPGDPIAEAMVVERPFAAGTAASSPVVASRDDLVGKVARRTLLAGKAVPLNAVAVPNLVERGTVVSASYEDVNVTITTSVLALQSGPLNAAIQVRNIDSGKVILGSVRADGTVRIGAQ